MTQTAKVLLIYAHPESQDSVANRVLLKPALQLSNVTVHDLYAHYPDFFIDIPHEQALLREHDVIVFADAKHGFSNPLADERAKANNVDLGYNAEAERQGLEAMYELLDKHLK